MQLLTLAEVATEVGVHYHTLRALVQAGSFPEPMLYHGARRRPRWDGPTVRAWRDARLAEIEERTKAGGV